MKLNSKFSTLLWSVAISLGIVLSLGSCKKDEPVDQKPEPPVDGDTTEVVVTPEFSVDFKSATSSSLTFEINTVKISQLAYDILPATEEEYVDPLNLFEVGEIKEIEADGTSEIVFDALEHVTAYKAYFAAVDTAGNYLADMFVLEASTLDFEEDVVIYDITTNEFKAQFRMPQLQNEDNVIKWGLAELATYNMNSKMSMWGYTTDAEILNMSDDVYHNYFRNDTTFIFNEDNSIVRDANGNPVDDDMGGILTYYNPIVPGQPNILLFGEFAWGEHPWGFGQGYYSYLFDYNSFMNDYYENMGGGMGPRQTDETTMLDESQYWSGYYSKHEFTTTAPQKLDAEFNIEMELTPKGGVIKVDPDAEIEKYVFLAMDQYTYDMVLPYLNNDPSYLQWYVSSYNAAMMLGAQTMWGPMYIDLEEIFWEMERDINYYLFFVGLGDDSGLTQAYEEIVITLPEPSKPAPEVVVTAIDNPYGYESPYEVWFNVKAPNGDLDEAMYLCNYSREFENILGLGETYSNYFSYYGNEFAADEVAQMNTPEGLDLVFTSHPNMESRLIVMGYNDEGTPSDVDNSPTAFANNTSSRVQPKDPVDSPLYEELQGEWTATASVRYNTYINNELTRVDTVVVSKVRIGDLYSPETPTDEVYAVYQEALGEDYSKEYVDMLYQDFKQEESIFMEDVKSQNRILCLGFDFGYDTWNEARIGSASPYELFIHDSYGAVNNAGIFYDFGNKWYLEIDEAGNVTAPFNCDRLYPANAWNYSSELYMAGVTLPDGNNSYSIMRPSGNPDIWPAFDAEISEDKNTITLKGYDLNGMPAYPNIGYENWGYTYLVNWTVSTEVVLTRGWDEANDYYCIGDPEPSIFNTAAPASSVSGTVSAKTRPHSRTIMMALPKVKYQTTDYKAVTCEEFQHRVIEFVNSNNKRR